MQKFFLLFLLLAAFNLQGQEIGVWGWSPKSWNDLLRDEFGLDSAAMNAPDNSKEIPVDEFRHYKLVILAQSSPKSLSPEQHEEVRRYLENGGFLLINHVAITGMAEEENKGDLSNAESWLGAGKYAYGEIHSEIFEPKNPALQHLDRTDYAWLTSMHGISELTNARSLIGQHDNAIVLTNRVGKGGVIFIFPEILGLVKGSGETEDSQALLKVVEVFLHSILSGTPEIGEVFGPEN